MELNNGKILVKLSEDQYKWLVFFLTGIYTALLVIMFFVIQLAIRGT